MTEGAFLPCESLIVTLLDSLHSVRVSVDCLSPQVGLGNMCKAPAVQHYGAERQLKTNGDDGSDAKP